mgnify:CR=1 FL=1
MNNKLLDIFANFNIDSLERLKRMKDSFNSFYNLELINKWVINIRGEFKAEAKKFLKKKLKKKIIFFNLNSKNGWFHDSREMVGSLKSDHIFFWVEDHIFINKIIYLEKIILDIKKNNLDFFSYSWFHKGNNIKSIKNLGFNQTKNIYYANYSPAKHKKRLQIAKNKKLIAMTYIVSCPSIFSRNLFLKLITKKDPLIPRWPKITPFDMEKQEDDLHWLPYKIGFSKKELFVSIDDDHDQKNYSLISRKIYPNRVNRKKMIEIRLSGNKNQKKIIYNLNNTYYIRYKAKVISILNKIYSHIL